MAIKKYSLIAAAVAGFAFTNAALASDGTITINGSITDATCTIDVNSGGANATVTLPTVSASTLDEVGKTAGQTPFTIALTGCSGDTLDTVYARFEDGANVDSAGRLNNTGTATGVQVELVNANNGSTRELIEIGKPSQASGAVAFQGDEPNNKHATLQYAARYYAAGTVGAGDVSTTVTYSIDYN